MSGSEDEYEAYYTPLDLEDGFLFQSDTPRNLPALSQRESTPEPELESVPQSQQTLPSMSDDDEFDAYDLSEFTAEDFAYIDAALAPIPVLAAFDGDKHSNGNGSGGPLLKIELEGPADCSALVKAPSPKLDEDKRTGWQHIPITGTRTPYQQFRSWKNSLSVSDLVSPAWCEVQFDYGLRGRRHEKPEARPKAIVTAKGKTIQASHSVAKMNYRVQARGTKVHKVLEREIHPKEVRVQATTQEERWGIRLVNMLSSVGSLLVGNCCREMPVFGIVHNQVVIGTIDELVRRPRPLVDPVSKAGENKPSPKRRSPAKRELPSTPSTKRSKKSRRTPSPSQPTLTSYFNIAIQVPDMNVVDPSSTSTDDPMTPSTPSMQRAVRTPPPDCHGHEEASIPLSSMYTLHLSDTKTRQTPTLPPEEDTFSSRLQLMLYHRLLSCLLADPMRVQKGRTKSPESLAVRPLNFEAFWRRLGLDPTRPFSDAFLRDSGLQDATSLVHCVSGASTSASHLGSRMSGPTWCLNDLTAAWRQAAEALSVDGVDETLTLVYRLQPGKKKKVSKKRLAELERIARQEEVDLAKAIEASLNDTPRTFDGEDHGFVIALVESLRTAGGSDDAVALEGLLNLESMPDSRPAAESNGATSTLEVVPPRLELEESDIASAKERSLSPETAIIGDATDTLVQPGLAEEDSSTSSSEESDTDSAGTQMPVSELDIKARVLGSKQFVVEDGILDGYLDSILQWWHGKRLPNGVGVNLTRRCRTCEYMNGCEWRESKADEALKGAPIATTQV